ncbi:Protein of unknown function, partial [Gryllus bimaculatus]
LPVEALQSVTRHSYRQISCSRELPQSVASVVACSTGTFIYTRNYYYLQSGHVREKWLIVCSFSAPHIEKTFLLGCGEPDPRLPLETPATGSASQLPIGDCTRRPMTGFARHCDLVRMRRKPAFLTGAMQIPPLEFHVHEREGREEMGARWHEATAALGAPRRVGAAGPPLPWWARAHDAPPAQPVFVGAPRPPSPHNTCAGHSSQVVTRAA